MSCCCCYKPADSDAAGSVSLLLCCRLPEGASEVSGASGDAWPAAGLALAEAPLPLVAACRFGAALCGGCRAAALGFLGSEGALGGRLPCDLFGGFCSSCWLGS